MRICAGTKRVVLVTKTYTYKVPKPRVCDFMKDVSLVIFNKRIFAPKGRTERTKALQFIRDRYSIFITAGWEKNRTEAKRSNVLAEMAVKTRFSFWGFVNIQETAIPSKLHFGAIIDALLTELDFETYNFSARFGHALKSRNFGFQQGRLKFVDYGNDALCQFVLQHRDTFTRTLAKFSPQP